MSRNKLIWIVLFSFVRTGDLPSTSYKLPTWRLLDDIVLIRIYYTRNIHTYIYLYIAISSRRNVILDEWTTGACSNGINTAVIKKRKCARRRHDTSRHLTINSGLKGTWSGWGGRSSPRFIHCSCWENDNTKWKYENDRYTWILAYTLWTDTTRQ